MKMYKLKNGSYINVEHIARLEIYNGECVSVNAIIYSHKNQYNDDYDRFDKVSTEVPVTLYSIKIPKEIIELEKDVEEYKSQSDLSDLQKKNKKIKETEIKKVRGKARAEAQKWLDNFVKEYMS